MNSRYHGGIVLKEEQIIKRIKGDIRAKMWHVGLEIPYLQSSKQ